MTTHDADLSFLLLDSAYSLLHLASRVPWLSATETTDSSLAALRIAMGHVLVAMKDQWPLAFELALALHTALHAMSSPSYVTAIPFDGYGATEWKNVSARVPLSPALPIVYALSKNSPAIVHLLHWLVFDSLLLFPTLPMASASTFVNCGAWSWKSKPYFAVRNVLCFVFVSLRLLTYSTGCETGQRIGKYMQHCA